MKKSLLVFGLALSFVPFFAHGAALPQPNIDDAQEPQPMRMPRPQGIFVDQNYQMGFLQNLGAFDAQNHNFTRSLQNAIIQAGVIRLASFAFTQAGTLATKTGKIMYGYLYPAKAAARKTMRAEIVKEQAQEEADKKMIASLQQSQIITANNFAILKQESEYWNNFVPKTETDKKIKELALEKNKVKAMMYTGIKPNELAALSSQDDNKSADRAKLATPAAPKLAPQPAPTNGPAELTLAEPAAA